MRATTCWIPNVSRATRAAMMLELSPLETAANASARLMPAFSRTSWSNPWPVTLSPLKPGPTRRNASGSESMIDTVWLRSSRLRASVEPTRPQPMITTCTTQTLQPPDVSTARMHPASRGGSSLSAREYRRRVEAGAARPQAAQLAAGGDPAAQAHRPAGVRERRAVVRGLRPGRDPHHAVAGRRVGVRLVLEDRHRGRVRDGRGGRVLPPDRARLPERRWRLRGRDRQPR